MSKTEIWVIQRDDGKYIKRTLVANERYELYYEVEFVDDLLESIVNIYKYTDYDKSKKCCLNIIKKCNLQNCKPVKVEIRVVGE